MTNKQNISIEDISKIRTIINLIINTLENTINDFKGTNIIDNENKELMNFLIGNKDSVITSLTKITNLLVKLIPLEEKLNQDNINHNEKLCEDDIKILKRYICRCGLARLK